MWQTKYPSAVPKNFGFGFDFRLCSEGNLLTRRPQFVSKAIHKYLIFGSKFDFIGSYYQSKLCNFIALLSVAIDYSVVWYPLQYRPRVLANLGFGLGPKPK
jgi:hypothetical protein